MTRIDSSFLLVLTVALAAALALVLGAPPAFALDTQPFFMEILVDGSPVPEYFARGVSYVEALRAQEYSVRLTNRTGSRIAVALSVDGLNSIDAKRTSARDASKWILDPYESIIIDGWQTSSATARRFFFTSEKRSYGAWLGETQNLGVISAAAFRERPVPVISRLQPPNPYDPGRRGRLERGSADGSGLSGEKMGQSSASRADAPAQADSSARESSAAAGQAQAPEAASPKNAPAEPLMAPDTGSSALGKERSRSDDFQEEKKSRDLSDELAATGIGRELDHHVQRVFFDHEQSPAAVLEVRYEYRSALVKLGVLRRCDPSCDDRLARRERGRGFEDPGYAPDPYRPGR